MWTVGALGFTAPLLLIALAALPVLWLILRAVPPAPIRRRFPGVALLLGLTDDETQTDRTPWWLLLLRMLAVAGLILAFAGPVLNPEDRRTGSGPLLVVLDGTWADARDWPARIARVDAALEEAARDGRTVAVTVVAGDTAPEFLAADAWASRLPALAPRPWVPDADAVTAWAATLDGGFETFWLSDGLDHPWRADLLAAFEGQGTVRVFQGARGPIGLRPAEFDGEIVRLTALRSDTAAAQEVEIAGLGPDPSGIERELARVTASFAAGEGTATVEVSLPAEIRNRMRRFEVAGLRSAGAVAITDDSLRRREVALIAGAAEAEGLQLLSPTHYLERALAPTADLLSGTIGDVLPANPDVIVLADVATVTDAERAALVEWIEGGGMLLRFAGPRLASSGDLGATVEDPLLPVRLRAGGRTVGGAMSWGEPKALAPFPAESPFFGLPVPPEVTVNAQVMAQPDPTLSDRVIAALADGTPLVTRNRMGEGQVVLFHVTANAEWSTLPLSGLFVGMLERLAVSTRAGMPSAEDLAGTVWTAEEIMDAYGQLGDAGTLPGIAGEVIATARPGPDMPPGLYAGEDRRLAVNVQAADAVLTPAAWPARIAVEGLATVRETPLKGHVLAVALLLLMADVIASLFVAGRLGGLRPVRTGAAVLAVALALGTPQDARADDAFALEATSNVVLAYVLTGDPRVDAMSEAGLLGLSQVLFARTSIEPAAPMGVDLETDELAFFPFLYWPVVEGQPIPSDVAYARLNLYLRTGGMILFDTRDADTAAFGASSPAGRKLMDLARPLDIPPLEPIPDDHVLTRTFYLIQDFPGRHMSRDVWVEAAPADAVQADGMPFRNLNDNVTPVV
ncbi:MAG: DUF4159 domain-containing protein, partial [Rhodobacteraceae bacterium]|nr:DUF4159 domain-containing protein [Paracoccaceae bacterium]